MTPSLRWLPGLLCCLSFAGCCSISQGMVALFCGPSTEDWTTVSFATAENTRKTFQQAIARDDSLVIYRCWSEDFKRAYGLGILEHEVAWAKIKKQIPGIYALGKAQVVATPVQEATVVEYILEVAFHRFRMRLKRFNYSRVVVPGPGQPIPKGRYLKDFSRNLVIRHGDESSTLEVRNLEVDVPDLLVEDVSEVTLGREWMVDLFEPVTDTK